MAVDLSCYVSKAAADVELRLDALSAEHRELFPEKFLISKVRETSPIHKEIALEYGLKAESFFLVSLNDKRAANQVNDIAGMLKQALGESNVIILQTNEVLI